MHDLLARAGMTGGLTHDGEALSRDRLYVALAQHLEALFHIQYKQLVLKAHHPPAFYRAARILRHFSAGTTQKIIPLYCFMASQLSTPLSVTQSQGPC